MSTDAPPRRVGELRPSALIHTFGVGAAVELPGLAVMVMGLDEWRREGAATIEEPRLLQAVRREPGLGDVRRLLAPPIGAEAGAARAPGPDFSAAVGVPVGVFPRWLVCPICRRLAPIEGEQFRLRIDRVRPERSRYVHVNCNKGAPQAVPARFVIACEDGHMDDFPWVAFVHRVRAAADVTCKWQLRLNEFGASGEAADVFVQCETCDRQRPMANAFGERDGASAPSSLGCTGAHPHLRRRGSCGLTARAILLGASNSWFSVTRSALSLPAGRDPLGEEVARRWGTLSAISSPEVLRAFRAVGNLAGLEHIADADLMAAIARRRGAAEIAEPADLRVREWELLTEDDPAREPTPDFEARRVAVPAALADMIERVMLVERLREVQALIGFTRVRPPGGPGEDEGWTALSRHTPDWLPATEVHGEGIFLRLREERVAEWRADPAVIERASRLIIAHREWCARRAIADPPEFPGMRAILVHSLAHAIMRRMALDSGYSQSAIRERLYVGADGAGEPMAGLLIYTAAPGSEGTLGGLVSLGAADRLGPLIAAALTDARLCDSDPLCAEHVSDDDGLTLHGAACYACLFAPETSCERGNRHLDRGVLGPLITGMRAGFFPASGG